MKPPPLYLDPTPSRPTSASSANLQWTWQQWVSQRTNTQPNFSYVNNYLNRTPQCTEERKWKRTRKKERHTCTWTHEHITALNLSTQQPQWLRNYISASMPVCVNACMCSYVLHLCSRISRVSQGLTHPTTLRSRFRSNPQSCLMVFQLGRISETSTQTPSLTTPL